MPYIISYLEKILDKLADILLPKEQIVKYLEGLGSDGLFENLPRAENFDLETGRFKAIFNYRNRLCRQAIWEMKFRGNKKLIQDFAQLLYEFILDELGDLQTFHNFHNVAIIPIPSSKARLRERGFNQCVLLAKELIRIDRERGENNFTLIEDFLIKKEETAHQSRTKSREQRLENLRGTFTTSLKPPKDYSFIIIDDVITTGATMNEAFRTLKTAGAKRIIGFSLAH